MYSNNGSAAAGTRSLMIIISGAIALAASTVGAEQVATINGTTVDSSVLAVYSESRAP